VARLEREVARFSAKLEELAPPLPVSFGGEPVFHETPEVIHHGDTGARSVGSVLRKGSEGGEVVCWDSRSALNRWGEVRDVQEPMGDNGRARRRSAVLS